jgi:tetratricopeptide (TPR) repeat protein
MDALALKTQIAALVNQWLARSGLRKETAASRAELSYQAFYRAYLDPNRPFKVRPDRELALVRAFSERLTERERCRAAEALQLLDLAGVPFSRFSEIAALFPPAEWDAALSAYLALQQSPSIPAAPPADPHHARLPTADLPPVAALPQPHTMPFGRNPLFAGRSGDLLALAGLLTAHRLADGRCVAISGLGGVGKTELAIEFVHRYGQFFAGGVFWLNASDADSLASSIAACGEHGLVADWADLPFAEQVRQVRLAWQAPIPRLLVFDGCEDEALLAQWRPTSGGCSLLITCRRAAWPQASGVQSLAVTSLPRNDSVALLRRYRPEIADTPQLEALAAEVGDLPLALHLLGSYLESYRHDPPFGEPAHLLRELRSAGVLAHSALSGQAASPVLNRSELNVARSFAVSLARLDPDDPADLAAQHMLGCAGYCAPDELLPRSLLGATLAANGAEKRTARAIQRLLGLGLLSSAGAHLRIHPLVAAFARTTIADLDAVRTVEQALIATGAQHYDAGDLALLRMLLPHARLRSAELPQRTDETAFRLVLLLANLLEASSDLQSAVALLDAAVQRIQTTELRSNLVTGDLLNDLACVHEMLGNYTQALQLHEQALTLRQSIGDPAGPDIAESLHNIAIVLINQERLEQATPYLQQALERFQALYGSQHERTLAAQNGLGMHLVAQGEYAAAVQQFDTLLAQMQALYTPTDRRRLHVRNNLATALSRAGDFAAAQTHFQAVVATYMLELGETHPETLIGRYNLAQMLIRQGQIAAGVRALRELREPILGTLGAEHVVSQRIQATLAQYADA